MTHCIALCVCVMQLTEEQKKWLDVLRLKGTAWQGQKDNSLLPSNPVRRSAP